MSLEVSNANHGVHHIFERDNPNQLLFAIHNAKQMLFLDNKIFEQIEQVHALIDLLKISGNVLNALLSTFFEVGLQQMLPIDKVWRIALAIEQRNARLFVRVRHDQCLMDCHRVIQRKHLLFCRHDVGNR